MLMVHTLKDVLNQSWKNVGERDGYVPDFMPNEHYGDYIHIEIDVETGRIVDWKKPTQKELKDSMDS
jgi:hypothetical protein